MRVNKPKKSVISSNGPTYSIPIVPERPLTAFSSLSNSFQGISKNPLKSKSPNLPMKAALAPPEICSLPIWQDDDDQNDQIHDAQHEKPMTRPRRQTLMPQIRPKMQVRPSSLSFHNQSKDDSSESKLRVSFPFANSDITHSLTRLAQINHKLQQNQPLKGTKNETTPAFSNHLMATRSTTTKPDFQGVLPPKISDTANNKHVSIIKIVILSNWGHKDTVACSEIDMLGKNHYPLPVDRIYIEPVNHPTTKISRLINGDMVKHTLNETWTAKWPPTPPLQSISIIIKANVFDNVVDSMRFWPTNIDPTMNIKGVEVYVDDDPVYKGDLPQDFGQVIPLTQMSSDSSEYEYQYEDEDEVRQDGFKIDLGIGNNEINKEKKQKKKRVKKEKKKENEIVTRTEDDEKEMKKRNMKKILKQIRFERNLTIRQAKTDKYGIIPCSAIQNIEIRCLQAYESPLYFGYQWIRMFDAVGSPINVRTNATVTQLNCGKDTGPPGILFYEDGNTERTHYGMWRGEFSQNNTRTVDTPNVQSKNTAANSGCILVHFTEMTMVTAIVLYTFRHPKGMTAVDISAKNVQILVENRLIWSGRLRHRPIAEDDEAASPNDCATTVFLTAEKDVQEAVLKSCFPSMYQ